MSRANPEIFKAYDIRGVFGRDFDEQFAFDLGWAAAQYFKAKTMLVSRDLRHSSGPLKQKLMAGIRSAGVAVIDIGSSTTPLFYWAAVRSGAEGGITVTASHLPEQFNGFKLINGQGVNIGLENGLLEIKKIVDQSENLPEHPVKEGADRQENFWPEKYAEEVIKLAKIKPGEIKLKVGVRGNDLVRSELGLIFEKLEINWAEQGEIDFQFDPDADRLEVFNQRLEKFPGDFILGLLAKAKRGLFSRPRVVHDFRASRGVLEDLRRYGLTLFHSRVGHTLIKEEMRRYRADVGGELSGHFFFKETYYLECSYLALLRILKLLQKFQTSIDELVKPFATYANSGEINFAVTDRQKVLEEIKDAYKNRPDLKITELDGLLVEAKDWWFNVRMSNTESLVRLVAEARTKNDLEQKVAEISGIIKAAG